MGELNATAWLIAACCGLLVGLSKTGIPGLGLLAVVSLTLAVPARSATGMVLLMLVAGDVIAVAYYRRHAVWSHLIALSPPAVVGVVAGYLMLGLVNDAQLARVIGLIAVLMLVLNRVRDRLTGREAALTIPWPVAWLIGMAAGVATMLANAAGPIIFLYFLAVRLDKHQFIGTGAWYFLMLNLFKVPFSVSAGMITAATARVDLMLLPAVGLGAAAGIAVFKRIPQKTFVLIVELLTLAAAIKLIVPAGAWARLAGLVG